MRTVKLQMQLTIDGFVAGSEGELDWMTFTWDEPLNKFVNELTDSSDTILMGRKMTPGFIDYWENIVDNQPESPEFEFANKMVNTEKIVFSKTVTSIEGRNARIENGDVVAVINELKARAGKDIVVYGGAGFVSSLIQHNLIDEYYLFTNQVALGEGMRIFTGRKRMTLVKSTAYESGVVVNHLLPQK